MATASRALSGGAVRPVLRERVERAVQQLGYRPDLAAQAVARGTTNTVALIVDYLRSPFGVEITRGVVDAASRHGLVVNVTGSETHPGDLLEMIATARELRPRSIILATGRVQDPAIREDLIRALDAYQAAGGSVAIVDGLDLPFASCAFDEITASHALARTLVELGYQRPLVFNGSSERAELAGRSQALIDGFVLAGVPRESIRLVDLPTAISSAARDDELLAVEDSDVVLCVEGAVLPGVYRHIRSRGLRVGADVAVTAFGQYPIADALRPHLTTVMIPLRQAGELALEHALTDTDGTHLSLPCNLRIRASTPERIAGGDAPSTTGRQAGADPYGAVAVVVPVLPAPEMGVITSEFLQLAAAAGRHCIVVREEALLDRGRSALIERCDALVVWGRPTDGLMRRASEVGLPCVAVDLPSDLGLAQLSIEVAEGAQLLLEHLYSLGHVKVVYLGGPDRDAAEAQRSRGIDLFVATHADVEVRRASLAGETDLAERLQSEIDDGATAFLVHSEARGERVIRELRKLGFDIPLDVSVAAFSDGLLADSSELTSARVDIASAARAAWRLLGSAGVGGETRSLHVPLRMRGSTASARTSVAGSSQFA